MNLNLHVLGAFLIMGIGNLGLHLAGLAVALFALQPWFIVLGRYLLRTGRGTR